MVDTSHDGLKKIQSQLLDSHGCKACVLQTPPLRVPWIPWKLSQVWISARISTQTVSFCCQYLWKNIWCLLVKFLVIICARVESSVWWGMVMQPEKWQESLFIPGILNPYGIGLITILYYEAKFGLWRLASRPSCLGANIIISYMSRDNWV